MNKRPMDCVYLFIGGMVAYNIVMPILESVGNLIQSAINVKIGHMQMDIEERQCEHEAACELIKPVERQPTAAVGFTIPSESEEDYDAY